MGLQRVSYFQKILWAQFLHLLMPRKTLKSINDDSYLWLVVTFRRPAEMSPRCVHGCRHHPPSLLFMTYILIVPLSPSGLYFRTIWNNASWAVVSGQNKRCQGHLWEEPLPRVDQGALRELRKAHQRRDSSKPRPFCLHRNGLLSIWLSVHLLFLLPSRGCKTHTF